jgi:quercetin dioxygenase-like cupin family protein
MDCQLKVIGLAISVALISSVALPAAAQPADKGPVRAVLALGRVPSMIDAPMSIKLSRVSIPAGANVNYRGSHSVIYAMSGSVTITVSGDRRPLRPEEGAYLSPGTDALIQVAQDAPAELIQFELVRSADAAKPGMISPASVKELHQMKIPAEAIKPGPHEFSMTRVTLPAGASRPRPHTRSGAALYYLLSDGAVTIWPSATAEALSGESRTESRRFGDVQEEPYGFIHSWSPKADAALVLLQANISREGVPEIIFVK